MSTINNTARTNNSLVDNAYVHGNVEEVADNITRENRPMTAAEKFSAMREKNQGHVVSTPVVAKPSNGEHFVVIRSVEPKNGYGDKEDYLVLTLLDVAKNNLWEMSVTMDMVNLDRFCAEINMNNISKNRSQGIIEGKETFEALDFLGKQKFRVWTQLYKGNDGREYVKTYTNPKSYEKFARYIASQSAK